MNWKKIEPKIQNLQAGLQKEMKWMKEHSLSNDKFPKINATYDAALSVLNNSEYEVVVCGEVKKGKSSLLNAIIGKNFLPVDSNVATSQVFHISSSDRESFEIVFTDGSRMPINKDQLARYGSQVDAELRGEPLFNGRAISFIQVNLPIAFLPKGVNIVDTPGLGSLYKSHEWITQNYVTHASAVVFVLDPERPIVKQERKFINKILDITPYILYVMTKIDLYNPDEVDKQIARDREILAEIYGQRDLAAPQICPVSSKTLMDAATSEDDDLKQADYEDSRFPKMKEALMRTIYRAVGLLRTGIALTETANQVNKVNRFIAEMLKATVEDAQKTQRELEEKKTKLQNDLQKNWGEGNAQYSSKMSEVSAVCNSISNRVQQITSLSGDLYRHYKKKIDELESRSDVESLCRTMPQEIKTEIETQWQHIAEDTEMKVVAIVGTAQREMEQVAYGNLTGDYHIDAPKASAKDYFNAFRAKAFGGIFGTTIGATIVTAFDIASGGLTTAIIALGGAIAWALAPGMLLGKAKQELHEKLRDLMNEIRSELLDVKSGNRSLVQQYGYEISQSAEKILKNLLTERKEQMQKELEALIEQSRLDVEEKKRENAIWTELKNEWDAETTQIKKLIEQRKEIAAEL